MKGFIRALGRGRPQQRAVIRQRVKVNGLAIQVDGATGVGWGPAVAGDFPEGNICFLGAVAYLQFTKAAGASGITATFTGNYSIGSTPTADATLSTTDADIIGSTAISAATSGVSPVTRGTGVTAVILDNTDGSLELNLNLIIADAAISADDQDLTVTGSIDLIYAVMGDD